MFCGRSRDLWTAELRESITEVQELIVSLRKGGSHTEADALVEMLAKMTEALAVEQERLALMGSGEPDTVPAMIHLPRLQYLISELSRTGLTSLASRLQESHCSTDPTR